MTTVLGWEEKPWLLNCLGSLVSLLFLAHGLLRPIRARKTRRAVHDDQERQIHLEENTDGLLKLNQSLADRFMKFVELLIGDNVNARQMSREWLEAVRISHATVDRNTLRNKLTKAESKAGVLSMEALKLIYEVIKGCRAGEKMFVAEVPELEVPLPQPFLKYGTRLSRMEELVEEVKKGGVSWQEVEGCEATWLGISQIYILVSTFDLDVKGQVDWLGIFDSTAALIGILLKYSRGSSLATLGVFTRGLVTLVPSWERCKLARKLVPIISFQSNGTSCTGYHAFVVFSEMWIFLVYWFFLGLNVLFLGLTIWPYIWLPCAFWLIVPILSWRLPDWMRSIIGAWKRTSCTPEQEPNACGVDAFVNFSRHLDISDTGISFQITKNCVLSQVESGWGPRLASMGVRTKCSTVRKLVNLFLLYIVIPQAIEICCLGGLNIYSGEQYWWEALMNALRIGSFREWMSRGYGAGVLELL